MLFGTYSVWIISITRVRASKNESNILEYLSFSNNISHPGQNKTMTRVLWILMQSKLPFLDITNLSQAPAHQYLNAATAHFRKIQHTQQHSYQQIPSRHSTFTIAYLTLSCHDYITTECPSGIDALVRTLIDSHSYNLPTDLNT